MGVWSTARPPPPGLHSRRRRPGGRTQLQPSNQGSTYHTTTTSTSTSTTTPTKDGVLPEAGGEPGGPARPPEGRRGAGGQVDAPGGDGVQGGAEGGGVAGGAPAEGALELHRLLLQLRLDRTALC